MDTLDFVELLKKQLDIKSDYGISKLLGIKQQTLTSWRTRGSVMSEKIGEIVADKLNIPLSFVSVSLAAERSKCPNVKKELQALAR